jgi:hypothetical protein
MVKIVHTCSQTAEILTGLADFLCKFGYFKYIFFIVRIIQSL